MRDPLDDLIADPLDILREGILGMVEGTVLVAFLGMLAVAAALASGA